jgi:hypothetical protein
MKNFSKTQYPNLARHVSGIYYAVTRIGQGRRVTRSLHTKLLTAARLKLPDAIAIIRTGVGCHIGSDLTLGECLAAFLERKRLQGHKGRMLKPRALEYRRDTGRMLRETWPQLDQKAAQISVADCRAWADRVRPLYSGGRFNGMVETLRGALALAMEVGCCQSNPALAVHRAQVRPQEKFIPSRSQFTDILTQLDRLPSRRHAALAIRVLACAPTKRAMCRPPTSTWRSGRSPPGSPKTATHGPST